MPTYTVHAPPPKNGEAASVPERFRFVRDGFHFWAFLVPPLWLLMHRLWLAFVIFIVTYALIEAALTFAGASSNLHLSAAVLIGLLVGFEASSLQRWTLTRRGWRTLGFVVGEDEEMAERRFFAEWAKRPAETPALASPPSGSTYVPPPTAAPYAPPVRRGPPSGNDVIGLFPEPGTSR